MYVHDPIEEALPDAGIYRVGNEQQVFAIDTSSQKSRQSYAARHVQKTAELKNMCMRHGMSFISLSTQDDLLATLRRQLYLV